MAAVRTLSRPRAPALWLDAALKTALLAALFVAVHNSHWPQLADKAMPQRALLYGALAATTPAIWWTTGRRHPHARPYPHLIDALLVLPFFADVLFNLLDLYDRYEFWDDLVHLVLGIDFAAAIAIALSLGGVAPRVAAGLVAGIWAIGSIAWEVGEYLTLVQNSWEFQHGYRDTLGDLALGLVGAGIVVMALLTRGHRAPPVIRP